MSPEQVIRVMNAGTFVTEPPANPKIQAKVNTYNVPQPILKRQSSSEQIKRMESQVDPEDPEVQAAIAGMKSYPSLAGANLPAMMREASLPEAEREALHSERRTKLRKAAEVFQAKYEGLTESERQKAENQVDVEMYSDENLKIREALLDHQEIGALLDLWWK